MKPDVDEIVQLAGIIQETYTTTTASNKAKAEGDDVLGHACLFLRDMLLFMEFDDAIKYGDAGRVLQVIKFWAYAFRGAGLTNYAREALEILAIWGKELPDALRQNLEMSWFVNRWGRPRSFIASDLYIEHLNCRVKVWVFFVLP